MNTDLLQKWAEVLDYALQHATGQGSRTGFRWLQDAFNEYFQAHEEAVENGTCASFGGQSFSQHNRDVLAEKICLELGHHVDHRDFPAQPGNPAMIQKNINMVI